MKTIAGGRRPHNFEPLRISAMQRNTSRSLGKILENAASSASSSHNERLNAARAGIERGGNTAPGSQILLTANGLLGGGKTEATHYHESLKPDKKEIFNSTMSRYSNPDRYSKLKESEKSEGLKLQSEYFKWYRNSSKTYRGSDSSSQAGSSKAGSSAHSGTESRKTVGALSLTQSEMARREQQRKWSEDNR